MHYCTYGSDINLADLRVFLTAQGVDSGGLDEPRPAVLDDCRLRADYRSVVHGAGVVNIEPARGHRVEGIVIEFMQSIHAALRCKEGFPDRDQEVNVTVEIVGTGGARALGFSAAYQARLYRILRVAQALTSI